MSRPRDLSEADRTAWATYAGGVAPLPGRERPALPEAPPTAVPAPRVPSHPRLPTQASLPDLAVGNHPPGVDAATWRRLRSGRLAPPRRLDLHGYTAQRAHATLSHFLRVAHAERIRCVEIITGRGGPEGGILRRELPHWLNAPELRPLILALAHPQRGNEGAVRVLLRRPRARS